MLVHLVDGTYELFRHHFAVPSHVDPDGIEVAATRGVVGSVLGMLEGGATHIGVATDHVVESFRNELYAGYKTSEGMDPELLAQFPVVEDALRALGVEVWAMVEVEADDALASAAVVGAADERVEQVVICTPDKDLGQCVIGDRVVQLDRRQQTVRDEAGVIEKFGVPRLRSRTTWLSSATRPTGSLASRGGAPSPPRPSSRTTSSWRRSPRWPRTGRSTSGARRSSRPTSRRS